MKRTTVYVSTSLAVLLSVAALGIGAAVDTPSTLMSRGDYAQGRKAIDAESRVTFARCRDAEGSERDLCKAQARADEKIKKADLYARYHGTVGAAEDARIARAKASYEVAKARCGIEKGEGKIGCLRTARASQGQPGTKLASI